LVIAFLGMVAALLLLGLVTNPRFPDQVPASLGFGALVLLLAWAQQRTLRQAQTAQPLTPAGRVWNVVVFLVVLAAMVALVWWGITHRQTLRWPGELP
jgi:hypothetical protein